MALTADQIKDRLEYWRLELGFGDWFLTITVETPLKTGDRATASIQPEYRTGHFEFDPTRIREDELDAYIVHEMAGHMCTWPLMRAAEVAAGKNKKLAHMVEVANESTTTYIERLILRLKGLPFGGVREGRPLP